MLEISFPAAAGETRGLSLATLATMLLILGASVWVFAALVRRETRYRRAVNLALWAKTRNLSVQSAGDDYPELTALKPFNPKIVTIVRGPAFSLLRVQTPQTRLSVGTIPARPWNFLLHAIDSSWPPSALRPTAHAVSAADLFSLSSYPSLMPTQRFMVFGSQARAAATLARSHAPALLPPDIGLVLHERQLILDFSSREFDEIEFDRMIALATQLAPRLIFDP